MEDITGWRGAGKLRLQREKGGEKEDSDRKDRRKQAGGKTPETGKKTAEKELRRAEARK